jgi:CHAT domain-containing protein
VTSPPAGEAKTGGIAIYRSAAWIVDRHAVTLVPDLSSLPALRLSRTTSAPKPLIGFGDPIFRDQQLALDASSPAKLRAAARPYSAYWNGGAVDLTLLKRGLDPLPETRAELLAVARALDAPSEDLHFGRAATETAVKRMDLAQYRVVYFATHGLIAGEVAGLGEPALVLTLPEARSDTDDGLLTASEVAQLRLNADWVVLSACNTAAGENPGAEALSGLTRAFFYAGARALLVSHWNIDSKAAAHIASRVFAILREQPNMGRSQALRQAMVDYLRNESDPLNAYPARWAAFSVVGDGRSR